MECVLCRTGEVCLTGDVGGDRCSDVIAFNHGLDGTNAVFIGLSNGAGFGPATKAHDFFCTKSQNCAVGDVTGDNKADLIAFTRARTLECSWESASNEAAKAHDPQGAKTTAPR